MYLKYMRKMVEKLFCRQEIKYNFINYTEKILPGNNLENVISFPIFHIFLSFPSFTTLESSLFN